MYRTLSAPLVVQIELTEKCFNKCRHCYNYWRKSNESKFKNFPTELVDQTLDKLKEAGVFHLVMTGGEPLANKPALACFLNGIKKRGLTCALNSTLSGLTKSDVEHFQENGVLSVLVSLLGSNEKNHDAITQSRGSFSRTLNGIKTLKTTNIPISANMVVSALNINDITPTALLVKSLGIKKFFCTRAACPSNCKDFGEMRLTREQFKSYLKEIHNIQKNIGLHTGFLECYPFCGMKELARYSSFLGRKCMAGVTSMTISSSGEIRPCSHLDMTYGNIFNENLKDVWSRMTEWRQQSFLPNICKSCKIVGSCGGGCRMEAKTLGGNINNIDPFAEPSNIEYTAKQLAIVRKEIAEKKAELPKTCKINPKLRMRDESFGGSLFVNDKSSGLVDKSFMDFIRYFDPSQNYTMGSLIDKINLFFPAVNKHKFISRLFKQKIFVASKGGHI